MNEHAYAFQICAPGTRDVAVVKSNHEGLPARFQRAGLRGSRGSLDRYGGLPEANQRDADREGQMRRNTGNATNQRDGFIPMPRKKNAQNRRERIRPYKDTDQGEEMQWWANGEPV